MKTFLTMAAACLLAAGCAQGPKRIDASGEESVVSMGLDYGDLGEIAKSLTVQLTTSPFLNQPPYLNNYPVRMVLSEVRNETDIRNLPSELILSEVRSAALDSGKIRFVASFGEETDKVVAGGQEAQLDERFEQENVPQTGSLKFPDMALNTEFIQVSSVGDGARQATYVVRMYVADIKTGDILWEKRSAPIAKMTEKGSVGW
jgi:PBP1b-binding outer membrane lipoprotein LpoB